MVKVHTKEAAEALLRELPSVLGAFVREDINGHPREIHLLVSPGPNVKLLAQDVRDLLEERLGIEIDHRIISIAQLAEDISDLEDEASGGALTEAGPAEPRLRFVTVVSEVREQRVRVSARLEAGETALTGEATELDLGTGRSRAASLAVLRAAAASTAQPIRLELQSVSHIKAFDREYVVVSILAGSTAFGRSLLNLHGAQPIHHDVETAAALATLKAINRIMGKLLPQP